MHNIGMCALLCWERMPTHSRIFAVRQTSTEARIEQALATGPMTIKELAECLCLAVSTVRHGIVLTVAVPIGVKRIRNGRPWVRYALPEWKPAPGESETIGFNRVESVEQAIAEQPRTVAELSQHLLLSESTIRTVLPRTRAVVLRHARPSKRDRGRIPIVYGLPRLSGNDDALVVRAGRRSHGEELREINATYSLKDVPRKPPR